MMSVAPAVADHANESRVIRPLPAYAGTIMRLAARGQRPVALGVLLGDEWSCLDPLVPRVCISANEWAQGRYDFGFLRGWNVVAVMAPGASGTQFAELLCDLMRARPKMLLALDAATGWLERDGSPVGLRCLVRTLAPTLCAATLSRASRAYARALADHLRREREEDERASGNPALLAARIEHRALFDDQIRQAFWPRKP